MFWFNVPIGIVGTVWAALVLRELTGKETSRTTRRSYDLLGNALALGGLTGLVLGLSDAGLDGWSAPMVIIGLIAAASCCRPS